MIAVIMAGGVGSRFWPRSRVERPKQLLDIVSDQSMLRVTYDRLSKITEQHKIYIVAGPNLKEALQKELPEMPDSNLIVEPSGKNTAPAIGLVAALLKRDEADDVIGVFPADHLITDLDTFRDNVQVGIEFAKAEDALITFGIEPSRAATGYGYIKFDHSQASHANQIFKVERFTEKPDLESARNMVSSGDYLWNGGMFIWRISSILKALKIHLPEMYSKLEIIRAAVGRDDCQEIMEQAWSEIEGESIDYGVLEKASNVYVIKGMFDWNDVGSWDALYEIEDKDESGNILEGNIQAFNTENSLIHSKDLRIAAVGVKNMIIIKSGNAILIINRNESEQVKEVVARLKKDAEFEYL
ncbi:NTP transferase domain-containing protein [bacterium]|nr:NTP transferase domain-containing protein [bacterium]